MGSNSGTQTTQQQSQTQPWAPAIHNLQGILNNETNLQGQSGINPTEAAAIQQLTQNAGGIPNFGPSVANTAASYLGGDPYNLIKNSYSNYGKNIAPIIDPNNLNPFNTPGFSNALNTVNQDITNQINGEFASAGRTGSGMDTQTLSRGLSQGEGALIADQYNKNVTNLLGGLENYFNAGLGANSAMSNNVGSGAALAGTVPGLSTQGPGTLLNAGQTPFNLLSGNQGILSNLTVPIAGLGGQEQGSSTSKFSGTPSLLSQIAQGSQIFSNLFSPFSGGANSGVTGAGKFFGGLFGGA